MSKAMTAYAHCSKTISAKKNNERKEKLSERDRRVLKRIATSKMLTTATKVSAGLYQQLDQGGLVFTKIIMDSNPYLMGKIVVIKLTAAAPENSTVLAWRVILNWRRLRIRNERVNINVALFSYSRAFGDGPRSNTKTTGK
ncbi:hypothetical protein TNCV_5080691 [Trichonephila clavipes]|nr:hypothetical protein TNCV_5080691 [Trichonephila clavipes]